MEEAGERENLNTEVSDMRNEFMIKKVKPNSRGRNSSRGRSFGCGSRFRREDARNHNPVQQSTAKKKCWYCDQENHPLRERESCPAYGKHCLKCGRPNHFAICCRGGRTHQSSRGRGYPRKQQSSQNRVKKLEQEQQEEADEESDDSSYIQQGKHIEHVGKLKSREPQNTVEILISDVRAKCEPDSGASANNMDEYQYRALRKASKNDIQLMKTSDRLKILQSELEVIGEFPTVLRNKTRGTETKFLVIKGHMDSPPLLSKISLEDLGMLKIEPRGTLREQNSLRIKAIQSNQKAENKEMEEILRKHEKVFEGIGVIKEPSTGENIEVHLEMEENEFPVVQRPRYVPFYLEEPLKQWIEQGVEENIFEKVPAGEEITWCSPLVVQPKPKFAKEKMKKLESHMIRASIDMRIPNKAMKRSRCVQALIIYDFPYALKDCVIFIKLDLRQSYHQLEIDKESSKVATFSTPWGNYRPKRLVFGAKSSQDLFDEVMYRVFGGIEQCKYQRDDIILGGKSIEDHNRILQEVLQRAAKHNITFNREKCVFGRREIEFCGHLFTENGLKPDPSKTKAVIECGKPQSKEEVRSFLGMTGYMDNHIPNHATLTASLRKLTKKDVKFKWEKDEEAAFEKLKNAAANSTTNMYFDPNKKTMLRIEASYNEGISAGLFQMIPQGMKPVLFIRRSLTETEKRYSQTEKDALAIRWAAKRLCIYLIGSPRFKIVTAHKPLLPMFNKASQKVPPRIEKWVMEMHDLDYEGLYEPGKDEADPLDYLSRHPGKQRDDSSKTDAVVKYISRKESAVVIEQIQEETQKDETLQTLAEKIHKGNWGNKCKEKNIEPNFHIREELSYINGMIYCLDKIVLPNTLQKKIINISHKLGHLGATKTKKMMRNRYWFPYMNSMIEQECDKCYVCKVASKSRREEPIKVTIPSTAWEDIAIDFGGPYPDGRYNLVAVDLRSRYPVVETTSSTNFKATREKLKKIFATYGIPRKIQSDNGPPFNSEDLQKKKDSNMKQ